MKVATAVTILALSIVGPAFAQEAPVVPLSPIEGTWKTLLESEITIAACPQGFCGTLSRIIVPDEIKAQYPDVESIPVEQFTDQYNKDPALRSRPMQGLQILTLWPSKTPLVYDGEIYNPQDGNVYSGYVQVVDFNTIRLNGCILYNTICKAEDWVRVPPPPEEEIAEQQ